MELEVFLELVRKRRSIRSFRPDPVPAEILEGVLEAARWAPSAYNLQPTSFVVVTEEATRERLCEASLGQSQVREAPVVVVLAADARAAADRLEPVIRGDLASGALDQDSAHRLRQGVGIMFARGPLGLGRLLAAGVVPLVRLFRPLPGLPSARPREWAARQAMLAAMNLMLAAQAAGLGSVPMEGFDEGRVRRILGIPGSFAVPVLVPLGYPAVDPPVRYRLPLHRLVHTERW